MPVSTETFRERLTEENQVASVGRVLSEWLEMRTSGAKQAAEKLGFVSGHDFSRAIND
jgi:hypothetical protein